MRTGFVAVKPADGHLLLDHLYIRPEFQGRGIGAAVLAAIFARADAEGLPVRVGALRESASNRFYVRHGFRQVSEEEWDIHYLRPPRISDKHKLPF
jgi:GNAT superfamily N-acetyltransferase